jgi:hypothetical protein
MCKLWESPSRFYNPGTEDTLLSSLGLPWSTKDTLQYSSHRTAYWTLHRPYTSEGWCTQNKISHNFRKGHYLRTYHCCRRFYNSPLPTLFHRGSGIRWSCRVSWKRLGSWSGMFRPGLVSLGFFRRFIDLRLHPLSSCSQS